MNEIINEILEETKSAYKESIFIENKIIQEKLLSIMGNLKYLEKEIINNKFNKKKKKISNDEKVNIEIQKVKRKVPLWIQKQNQYNYKILKSFMDLSNHNKYYVNVTTLETHCNINNPKIFLTNYNLLKTISEKNHAKVFEEENGQICLWGPIRENVIEFFR